MNILPPLSIVSRALSALLALNLAAMSATSAGKTEFKMFSSKAIDEALADPVGNIQVVKVLSRKEDMAWPNVRIANSVQVLDSLHGGLAGRHTIWNWDSPFLVAGSEYLVLLHGQLLRAEKDALPLPGNQRDSLLKAARALVESGQSGSPKPPAANVKTRAGSGTLKGAIPAVYHALIREGADFALVRVLTRNTGIRHYSSGAKPVSEYEVMVEHSFFDRLPGPRKVSHDGPFAMELGKEYLSSFSHTGFIDDLAGTLQVPPDRKEALLKEGSKAALAVKGLQESGGDPYQKGSGPRSLSDPQIASILKARDQYLAVVKIHTAAEVEKGTRSWGAEYSGEILENFNGKKTGTVRLYHFGPLSLKAGYEYILAFDGTNISNPFLDCVRIPTQGRADFIAKHREAAKRLKPKGGK